jgi:hypothetical protein
VISKTALPSFVPFILDVDGTSRSLMSLSIETRPLTVMKTLSGSSLIITMFLGRLETETGTVMYFFSAPNLKHGDTRA